MRTAGFLTLAFALMGSPAAAATKCDPPPGVEKLWANPATHFILFGEMHGTAETPKLFGESVCAAIAAGKTVTVGFEYPRSERQAIEAYLDSKGTIADRSALLSGGWKGKLDGRGSEAMFAAIERLRILRAAGARFDLITFVPDVRPRSGPSEYEADMAAVLADAPKTQLVMALMGNIHARVTPELGGGETLHFPPMASHLPQGRVIAVQILPINGGTAWNCQPAKDGSGSECAPHAMWNTATAPGLTLFAAVKAGYHGVIGVDHAIASPPAAR